MFRAMTVFDVLFLLVIYSELSGAKDEKDLSPAVININFGTETLYLTVASLMMAHVHLLNPYLL